MGSSSLASPIVNLVKAAVGAGMLSVPYFFAQTGILLGVAVLLFFAVAHGLALHLLALCVLQSRGSANEPSLHTLAESAFGHQRVASMLVPGCVIVAAYGVIVAYFVVIGDLLPEVVDYFGVYSKPWSSRGFLMAAIGWCIELPLSLSPNVDSLKFSSMIGNIGVAYIIVVLLVFAIGVIQLPTPQQHVSFWPPPHSQHTSLPGMMESAPISIFAYVVSMNLPSVIFELGDTTVRHVDVIIIIAISICFVIYALVGICGSTAFGASVTGNVLQTFPNEQGTVGGLMSIFARVAIVINVMGGIPLYMHPLRATISQVLFRQTSLNLKFSTHASITVVLFVLTWGTAVVNPRLDEVMALVGSSAQMLNGFTLPALFYVFFCRGQRGPIRESPGISLQSLGSEDGFVTSGMQSCQRQRSTLRKLAWVMAMISFLLIPVMLAGEVWKMLNEHG